ncbi:putative DNA binding domain-containing protein [Hymenobacter sp. BT635]|uniref:DNA binding domain-containing protein n=1 Tax=Hymenobacter nitidus TaxID=2880929 RepID=A0ABS8AGY6_9BACT|nr:ATP-binding protein [Hymenobacter nitidus]MCB2379222.1 putative DNA binding domain-containing protein [Hymenobacter nitidus]
MTESHVVEYKSLRKAIGPKADISDLSKTCVCLANAQGGTLIIGIEDGEVSAPAGQVISQEEANLLLRALSSRSINVGLADPVIESSPNGGQYLHFKVHPSVNSIATTSDGRIYMRLGEECQPIRSEDLMRMAAEKGAFQWELQSSQRITLEQLSTEEINFFIVRARQSDRVSQFVKTKTANELLEYFNLIQPDGIATNLGILWLGTPAQRARLRYPLAVQYIVYDEREQKVRKETWLDYQLNPLRLLEDITAKATELHYYHELPMGLYRKQVRHYPAEVIRELLANALAHRLYTSANDITISVYPDRMELASPGGLPMGVTKDTILHERVRRNPHLMLTFQAVGLMEGEGSGYDLIYEKLSRDAKPLPEIESSFNTLRVTVQSKVLDTNTLLLLDYLASFYNFTQKEIISLGIIAQHRNISATALALALQLREEDRARSWVGRLVDWDIVLMRGVKKGTEYIINPKVYAAAKLNIKPSLKTLEPHRLRALLEEDLKAYPGSLISEMQRRLDELSVEEIRREVYAMVKDGILQPSGANKNRRYALVPKNK